MNKWNKRSRPERLERRLEFSSYEMTRDFLDRLGDLCENRQRFPDISFGKNYVNLTLKPDSEDKDAQITESDNNFASEIDKLINK